MGAPTVYLQARKSLSPKKVSKALKRKWLRHRKRNNLPTSLPPQKSD